MTCCTSFWVRPAECRARSANACSAVPVVKATGLPRSWEIEVIPGLASRYSDAPMGRSTAIAVTGRPDFTASDAGRSPISPTSRRWAANPASTSGPLPNSTKLTL